MEDKVENSSDRREMGNQEIPTRQKGGLITIPFIIANEAFEKVASYGLIANIIFYLRKDYHMSVAKAANVIFFWNAAISFMPLLGAFLSDSYLGRFLTIGFGSMASLSGIILLWLTAMIPKSKPPPCNQSTQSCRSPTPAQLAHLFSSFALISIGAGGVRPCSIAFGADQLESRDNSKHQGVLESFFGWYYASSFLAVVIALTGIVYIQDHVGWRLGFGVPAILIFLSVIMFFIASPLYLKKKPKKSLFTGFAQVIVVAYRNRNLSFPFPNSSERYHHGKDSKIVVPTDKLRFLNKACITRNPEQEIAADGLAVNPWRLCTIEQVEELKALIKVLPLWSTGIMLSINASQTTFILIQASSMDRHISQNFEIPPASFATFGLIVMVIWVILYDRVILPLASKIKGKPVQLGVKLRMGIGLLLSCMAMVVSAIVEMIRRGKAIQEGNSSNDSAVSRTSAVWLVPQYCLLGLAEAFTAIGQTEFFYSELPKSMSSIAAALFGLGMAVSNLLSSVVVSIVTKLTSRGGKESWVSNNINKGHYDYYYWVLAIMSFINLLYFLLCSWAYGPCGEQATKVRDTGNDSKGEEALSNRGIDVKGARG
ncbi:hypothetical protein SLEP1_g36300 [Rubroshorea leprosula]|uniref:NPF family transporter n=1 Tax=Rubroshorea leprosula TaxID=152421 RepID=A0AAV5KRB4_9ROSI|nr:hypothetical protein SLEP1_g36300 [Rubroshorea leprosula]